MKHRYASLAAIALLAGTLALTGCGSSDSSGSSGAGDKGDGGSGAVDDGGYSVLTLVSAKGAGGTTASTLTWLRSDADAAEYAAQFDGPMKQKLATAFETADVPAGDDLFASIVSVGCGAPTEAIVFRSFEGMVIQPSDAPTAEGCGVKTTTVAIAVGPPPG